MKREMIYVGDPLCGWCFGFSEIFETIIENYNEIFDISIIMGGLKVEESIPVNKRTKPLLYKNWNNVMNTTGQKFALDLVDDLPEGDYNSEPMCRAVLTVKELSPANTLSYYKSLHKALYLEGKNITESEVLCNIAGDVNIDKTLFMQTFSSDEIREKTVGEFNYAEELGVLGFPAFVLIDESGSFVLNQGYKPLTSIDQGIKNWINGIKQIIF